MLKNFYDTYVVPILTSKPLKLISYFFSHGFVHLVVCVLVIWLTYRWAEANVNSSNMTMHNLALVVERHSGHPADSLKLFTMDMKIDNDTVLKETGKYRDRIKLSYQYSWSDTTTNSYTEMKDTFKIKLMQNPLLHDLSVESDSITYEEDPDSVKKSHKWKKINYKKNISTKKDSTTITTKPAVNEPRLDGGYRAASQYMIFYSNELGHMPDDSTLLGKLGLGGEDCYYNYYLGLPDFPIENCKSDCWFEINIGFGNEQRWHDYTPYTDKNLLFQYIYPEPDIMTNGYLTYYKRETIEKVAKNKGIIFQAIDIDAQNKNNRLIIILSVLVGTGAALFFDILIQLVRELRNVNRKKEEEELNKKVKPKAAKRAHGADVNLRSQPRQRNLQQRKNKRF